MRRVSAGHFWQTFFRKTIPGSTRRRSVELGYDGSLFRSESCVLSRCPARHHRNARASLGWRFGLERGTGRSAQRKCLLASGGPSPLLTPARRPQTCSDLRRHRAALKTGKPSRLWSVHPGTTAQVQPLRFGRGAGAGASCCTRCTALRCTSCIMSWLHSLHHGS